MDNNNTIVVEDDSQYTVGEIFENDVLFETDMNDQNELLTASKNSQNEATYTSTCDTNSITEITDNMNAITIKEITDKEENIKILKGQVILLREENEISRENF